VADDDAAGGQHLLDHAQAEREAEVQPNGVADDLGRKAVASVAGEGRRRHPVRLPALLPIRKRTAAKLTVPVGGIVYVLGRINFLGDRSFPPYMTTADLCAAFGVGESTIHAKWCIR
jgi:Domain of unknown function (DUF6398)